MKSEMINKTVQKLKVDYCRLSIVRNQDGFLTNATVRYMVYQKTGIEIILGTNLQLRVHFELTYKKSNDRFIYVSNSVDTLLPDMKEQAYITDFSVSDIFPLFADKSLLRKQTYEVLERLFERYGQKKVSMAESALLVDNVVREIGEKIRQSTEFFNKQLNDIDVDWNHPIETISTVSNVLAQAINAGVYDDIAQVVEVINDKFQKWVDAEYFATLQSNPLLKAKCVNKILPHISAKYDKNDKVALLVVDGFSYWQYTILRKHLTETPFSIEESSTLSWMPSITMLSRQAVFRGTSPQQDYKQNPENEKRLWFEYWKQHGFGYYDIQYLYDTDEFAINEGVKRLAVVTVEMDEKMHSSTDYKDLYSLTDNWCNRIMPKIEAIINAGYTLYLTTDHGSVLSKGWRTLTSVEKVFLYKDGSRGTRHLIYNNKEEQIRFYEENKELPMVKHDNWMSIRDNSCFAKENKTMITHGGSHFMEMVIPLIKINK